MESEHKVDKAYSVTIKVNAKGEKYGEYTVTADTEEELKENIGIARLEFTRQLR